MIPFFLVFMNTFDSKIWKKTAPKFSDAPDCKINGFLCLHKETWPDWTLRKCECPASCTHHSYIEQSKMIRQWCVLYAITPWVSGWSKWNNWNAFLCSSICRSNDVLFLQKASFRWEIVSAKVRNRRDVIFSFADFIVSFSGAAALLFGVNFWHFFTVCLKIIEKIAQILRRHERIPWAPSNSPFEF